MWLCRGNGAQVHNSERDPETRTAAGQTCDFPLAVEFEMDLFNIIMCCQMLFLFTGHQSGSVQYQHRRVICYSQRVYPHTLLQVEYRGKKIIYLVICQLKCVYIVCKCFLCASIRHLLVNPRDRRVVIIESILCPSHFRETLTKVFFKQFEVQSC